MLLHKEMHGIIECSYFIDAAPSCALALVVDDLGRMNVVVLPSRLLDPVTPVEVFAVHEEILVQPSHFFINLFADHHEGTADRVDLIGLIGTEERSEEHT